MDKLSHEEKNRVLFYSLVEQISVQAWMSLGKLKNPVTDKVEKNLEMAKWAIDMLDMIKEKTQGNLTSEEDSLLTKTIADLKLNYVDEYEKEKRERLAKEAEQKQAAEATKEPEPEKAKAESASSDPQAAEETKKRKKKKSGE